MMKAVLVVVLLGATTADPNGAQAQTPQTSAAVQVQQIQGNAVLPNQALRVGDLEQRDIYTPRGERLGSVKRVVLNVTDGLTFLVLEYGGIAGLGEKEFPLPVEKVYLQGGRLVVPELTGAELEAVADWDVDNQKYREMADSEIINVNRR
ncbi:PRC-barrel domain-containing protein [Microvirga arabica]|uniref:PRC-barrel domain-containing protein n=1 Tax=Microvirga arabica TaxID=1128671 RepID=UPI001939A5AA|nr:PRC-barrel domain-containing protein [Microvirga arabica]MBM1175143.1 PRC-barrel domain-containing protein [Microvirga arabica]